MITVAICQKKKENSPISLADNSEASDDIFVFRRRRRRALTSPILRKRRSAISLADLTASSTEKEDAVEFEPNARSASHEESEGESVLRSPVQPFEQSNLFCNSHPNSPRLMGSQSVSSPPDAAEESVDVDSNDEKAPDFPCPYLIYHSESSLPAVQKINSLFNDEVVKYLLGDIMVQLRREFQKKHATKEMFHYLERLPPTERKQKPTKPCRVCTREKKRKESAYFCPVFPEKPAMCVENCFKSYHSFLFSS